MDSHKERLRARGWSIQSEGTTEMTHGEMVASLANMPSNLHLDDHHDSDEDDSHRPNNTQNNNNNKRQRDTDTDNDAKRAKSEKSSNLLNVAKSRLSKWAARLFDPDRPRGLIEPPQTIPLNDEFIKAFGKREKNHDQALGVQIDIDQHQIEDLQVDTTTRATPKRAPSKVKINNLKYTTTEAALKAACSRFGPVQQIHLPLDATSGQNKGRAFVTFQEAADALACKDGLKELEGRPLTITFATDTPSRSTPGRYWAQDLSTKCRRCGQIGHMEAECSNPAQAKPCPLCAQTTHDLRTCPSKQVCFNCGVPGHVSRDCSQRRGLPPRRLELPPKSTERFVVCLHCHRTGHYLCRDLKWFVGLEGGLTCGNCGGFGHVGQQCDRPNYEMCSRNESVAQEELARAAIYRTHEEALQEQQRQTQQRKNHMRRSSSGGSNNNAKKRRAKSVPPKQRWGPRR